MDKFILMVLAQILNDDDLQDTAAQAVAEFLANTLPDVTEEAIDSFLIKIHNKLVPHHPEE